MIKKTRKSNSYNFSRVLILLLFISISLFFGYNKSNNENDYFSNNKSSEVSIETESFNLENIPDYSGKPYVTINNNEPIFTENLEIGYEVYSDLDDLGRCGVALANLGPETMPKEDRGTISSVKPSGWHSVKYDIVDGKYLYNRSHLIGFQLAGENANKKNLITGTRYMNTLGMLPFENEVAEYIEKTKNHVYYRVTPIFEGNNLVANGVQMEAQSVENDEIHFNVFVYNVQPGITIDYATGNSKLSK